MTGPDPADDEADDNGVASASGTQRLDKWLWFVRVIKTRTQAAGLVADGKVRINKIKVLKPAQSVRPGDVLTISVGDRVRVLEVIAPGLRRGPASEAQQLFRDLTPPPPQKLDAGLDGSGMQRDAGSGRPTKRDRRLLDRLQRDGS